MFKRLREWMIKLKTPNYLNSNSDFKTNTTV